MEIRKRETGAVVVSTRFSQPKGFIVYDAVQTGENWRVEATLPPKIPHLIASSS